MNALLTRLLPGMFSVAAHDAGLQRLAAILEVSADELASVTENPKLSYRHFTIRKRGGGERQITAPSGALKTLQRRLLRKYLANLAVHHAATALRPGGSIATHARRHVGQAIVLTVDLTQFFPATSARRIRHWFRKQGWDGSALQVLMRLCVYQGGLPQGAPTSPALSNLINRRLDEELSELAARHGARYSRYCDDLAFSWGIDAEPHAFRQQVEERLTYFGYQIQPLKGWRLQHRADHPEVTGLVIVGRRLRLPQRILARIRQLQSRWFGRSAEEQQQLVGYRGLLKTLKDPSPFGSR